MNLKQKKDRFQGFVFAYELTPEHIVLRFLRVIPLAKIKITEIDHMRLSAGREYLDIGLNFYWPSLLNNNRGQNPLYVIVTRGGRKKYFLRLGGKFHYQVRSAIGQCKQQASA